MNNSVEVIHIDKIEVINLIPKFLYFLGKANSEGIKDRWALWEEHYNFAAIPPGEEGRKLAKSLLENAWDKYQEQIEYIQKWEPNQPEIENRLKEVKAA